MNTHTFKQKSVSETRTHGTVICFLLAVFLLTACEKEPQPIPNGSNNIGDTIIQDTIMYGNVPYKPCPCEEGPKSETLFGEVYLFRDSIPQGVDYETINVELPASGISLGISTIVFNSKAGDATLTPVNKVPILSNPVRFFICNFPDFAKEWTIPQNGLKVSIEGVLALSCGSVHLGTYLNCILTNMEREEVQE